MRLREIRLEECQGSQLMKALRSDTSLLTRMAIKAIPLGTQMPGEMVQIDTITPVMMVKGSALTSLELVDLHWRLIGRSLEHLVSLEFLHVEESGVDYKHLKAVNRGKIDRLLNALPGLETRLPSFSRMYIKSNVLVDPKGLILFLSRLAGAKQFQLQILSSNFTTEDLSSLEASAHIDLL
jgi:hypothetical protein